MYIVTRSRFNDALLLFLALSILPLPASTQEAYSPYVDRSFPTNVYWGDTHVHTDLSADAVFTLGQDDAYRFARGEEVTSISGQRVKLNRPLDFLVIAEHGKNMGAQYARKMPKKDPAFRRTTVGKLWAEVQVELLDAPGANPERIMHGRLWPGSMRDVAVKNPVFLQTIWEQEGAGGEFFVNFSPGCSPKALKRMGKVLRSWRLNRRTDKSLNELAHFYSVAIRGWIQYYGAYYKTALRPLLQRINRYLVRWAQRKYKRFRGHQRRATHWLRRIAYREPYLFPHWRLGAMP